jgi:SPRY domain
MVGLMPLRPRKLHAVHIGKIPGGVGYHCNGHLYQERTCASFGPTWGNGDCIGTLVDMQSHQLSWYVNGEPTKIVKLDPDMDGYVFTVCFFTVDDSVELLPNINLPSLPSWQSNEDLARSSSGLPITPVPGSP